MTEYPGEYDLDVALTEGEVIGIRPIRPDDADELHHFFHRLGGETIYHRFFRSKKDLTPEELAYFTQVDYHDRMAFVAHRGGQIIGVGRYDRADADPQAAEVAFVVEDAWQGRGIGTQLLQFLTNYARDHDVERFRAFVLSDNLQMMRVFRNSGYVMRRALEDGVYEVEFPTEHSPEAIAAEAGRERRAVAASILPIFYPRSVAVIGASRNPASIGGRLFHNLVSTNFGGPVYPVNPVADVVHSVRAYRSVLDIPDPVDLAYVVVPADSVIDVVRQCAVKGVRGLVVISAGFSETGAEGAELEAELLEVVRDAGMRMVGPNCMGVLNTDPAVSLNGTFAPIYPPQGNVAMSSQSGALGIAILDYATQLGIGISSFVSVGNKADVSGNDLLLYWEEDPATDVILLYLESFGNPRRFGRLAQRISREKPIVAVKSGRTAAGTRAASSHTGALASLDVAVDALFQQGGVIRVDTLDELFEVTSLLANQPLPAGRRVSVLSNAGGPAILCVDALSSNGLEVPELSEDLQEVLRKELSPDASVANPVDMIASAGPEQYRHCLSALLASDETDAVVVIFIPASPEGTEETLRVIRETAVAHHGEKTILAVLMQATGSPAELTSADVRVPTYRFPEAAARALARAVRHAEWAAQPVGRIPHFDDIDAGRARRVAATALERLGGAGWLEPDEVEQVLGAFGIRLPASGVATSAEEAVTLAEEIGGPVVLKVLSPSAVHKTDVGGVVLNVSGEHPVRDAFARVTGAVDDAEGALVQEFVPGGHEVLIGLTEDPSFGPLVVFGLGGVFVELLGDVAFRITPLTDVDAAAMVTEVKAGKLLAGYRGTPPGDVEAVHETLLRISALAESVPEIAELDLNPVKVLPPGEGLRVVDARIRVHPVAESWSPTAKDLPAMVGKPR